MNADAFRHLYTYHFAENRKVWDGAMQLTPEQFAQAATYSHGSVRDQIIHLLDAEDVWFSELAGLPTLDPIPSAEGDDRSHIRAHWDRVEARTRNYLAALRDEMLFDTPITDPEEDAALIVWQVLLHVVNHATDHRAQILRQMHEMGVATTYQDYIFFVYGNP